MITHKSASEAISILKNGGLIIYPTEGVYGLGCDALNEKSVKEVFKIKFRSHEKSFITICSDISQLDGLIHSDYMTDKKITKFDFTTWIIPIDDSCPCWLSKDDNIAVRISNHPVVKDLCNGLGKPLISTSANISNQEYENNLNHISKLFDKKVECIVEGKLGGKNTPSKIIDIVTGSVLRN